MLALIHRFAMFFLGSLIGAIFGYFIFVAQDDAYYRYDWRKFVLPPALLLGLVSAWLGGKPLGGSWYSILLGIAAGGIFGTAVGVGMAAVVVHWSDLEREVRNMIGFCIVVSSLPLGMLVGGVLGARLGTKRSQA